VEDGQTKEEWKGYAETNKSSAPEAHPGRRPVRAVGAMRCHSQGLTIKLAKDVPLDELTALIAGANEWVKVVPNVKEATLRELTPRRSPAR